MSVQVNDVIHAEIQRTHTARRIAPTVYCGAVAATAKNKITNRYSEIFAEVD